MKKIILFLIFFLFGVSYYFLNKTNTVWETEEKNKFIQNCLSITKNEGLPKFKAENFCNCILENIMKRWSFKETEKEVFEMNIYDMTHFWGACIE